MIDTRSPGNALFATSRGLRTGSFGSTTSIQPLQRDDNLVVVKGSFGSCRVFDLRRLSASHDIPPRSQQSMLLELSVPNSIVHQTKSVKCTGLAVDPSENIAIAPCAGVGPGDDSNVLFAMWDIGTGALLRKLNLDRLNQHGGLSPFCELSSSVTCGYEMLCNSKDEGPVISREGSTFGLWFKTNVGNFPPDGGGIHHIRF